MISTAKFVFMALLLSGTAISCPVFAQSYLNAEEVRTLIAANTVEAQRMDGTRFRAFNLRSLQENSIALLFKYPLTTMFRNALLQFKPPRYFSA